MTDAERETSISPAASELRDETAARVEHVAPGAERAKPPPRSFAWFDRMPVAKLSRGLPWTLLGAGAAGAMLMAIVVLIASLVSGRDEGTSAFETRLARLEQVRATGGGPTAAAPAPKAAGDLAARLARLETAVAAPRPAATDPALANRMATIEGESRALGERIDVVARRSDDIATIAADARTRADTAATALADLQKTVRPGAMAERSEVEALAVRVAALDRSAAAMETELATRAAAAAAGDRPARLAVVAALLETAVTRGDPLAAELAAARTLAADPNLLAPLEPFASSGVPTAAALARELGAIGAVLRQQTPPPRDGGGFLDRLQANAEKLVRIRPLDEAPGDEPAAIISRVEARSAERDLAGAQAELAKLPAAMRAPAQAWIAKAQARSAATEASRRFAAAALAALGQPSH